MNHPRTGILAAGVWIVDVSKRINHWPETQTLAIIDQVISTNGGAAFNVACDLKKLDADLLVEGAGLIGEDAPGAYILETCRQFGVDASRLLSTSTHPTSFTDVMTERGTGRRTFFHMPGTNALFNESHLDLAQCHAKIFFMGYLGLLAAMDACEATGRNPSSRVFEEASRLGMLTAADLVSAPNEHLAAQVCPCLPHLDILLTNEWEAARLTGCSLAAGDLVTFDAAMALAKDVLALGVRGSVVLHFAHGAVLVSANGEPFAQSAVHVPKSEVVGTTGAGDAFAAGFLLGTNHGMTPQQSLELAVCSAATSLHAITCSDSIRPWEECLAYGRCMGFQPTNFLS